VVERGRKEEKEFDGISEITKRTEVDIEEEDLRRGSEDEDDMLDEMARFVEG
jgi:hypothetical protein